ncbi:MAG: sigma-70 family RNA polymerase sigma factor [Acidimicrobiales bacterium]
MEEVMRVARGGGVAEAAERDFDELFRAVWPRAVLAARRIVGPGEDPEGLAAEALTRAYDRWSTVRRHPAPEAWVLRVTINLALDRVRHRARTSPGLIDLVGAGGGGSVDSFDEATVIRLALCAALSRLPGKQRDAVALRYLGGCVEADIAASMKISPGTVKTHLRRGLEKLRTQAANDPEAHLAIAH